MVGSVISVLSLIFIPPLLLLLLLQCVILCWVTMDSWYRPNILQKLTYDTQITCHLYLSLIPLPFINFSLFINCPLYGPVFQSLYHVIPSHLFS